MRYFDDVFEAWEWCCNNASGPCEVFIGERMIMTFPLVKPDTLNSVLRRSLGGQWERG